MCNLLEFSTEFEKLVVKQAEIAGIEIADNVLQDVVTHTLDILRRVFSDHAKAEAEKRAEEARVEALAEARAEREKEAKADAEMHK